MKNIILIGFMGSGKTAAGRKVASKLKMGFFDMDAIIEKREKKKIKEIFNTEGEPYFRELEKNFINGLKNLKNILVSTGGGVVKDKKNIKALRKLGTVIYLDAGLETIANRLKKDGAKKRPLLAGKGDLLKKIEQILKPRVRLYRDCAHIVVDTSKKSLNEVVDNIVKIAKTK